MKRVDLIRHLEAHGCRLLREGGSHSDLRSHGIAQGVDGAAPSEIKDFLGRKICKDLEIASPER